MENEQGAELSFKSPDMFDNIMIKVERAETIAKLLYVTDNANESDLNVSLDWLWELLTEIKGILLCYHASSRAAKG